MSEPDLAFLDAGDDPALAYRLRRGKSPTLLFLPGYASDMAGTKALALDAFAARNGLAMLRFDYSGTGSSAGRFDEGTLQRWLHEALLVADRLAAGPLVVVGSSMGGWIALHLALHRPQRVAGLVGIAAAPDFTDWGFSAEQKQTIAAEGRLVQPNPYGAEPKLTTRDFWESGERLKLLGGAIDVRCPVRLLHGDADEDVPLDVAMELMGALRSADVQLTVLKGGGHRLSERHEIDAILRAVASLVEPAP